MYTALSGLRPGGYWLSFKLYRNAMYMASTLATSALWATEFGVAYVNLDCLGSLGGK